MFTGLPLLDRFYLSYIWLYAPWLDYDVSMHKVVELVVVIPTIQDHRNRSPDAKVLQVFVKQFLCLSDGR